MIERKIKFSEAINEATSLCMEQDKNVYIIGLGVPDPIGVFGTTKGLLEKYGPNRVYDMPISENAITGVALGSAIVGMRPVITHMRLEFAMLAIEQMVNQAAKWHYMFGGQSIAPLTIRMIVGRGWGQGPQHSQSLHAWFAHIPGLKVVMPSTAYDAKGLLISSIKDDNPVIFIEHRWLYNMNSVVPEASYEIPLGVPKLVCEGKDVTIVSSSYMTIEAIKAAGILKNDGINVDVIDLRTLNPFNDDLILQSVAKTGHLIVCDHANYTAGFSAEIISRVAEKALNKLKSRPIRITLPDCPTPTTRALSNYYYPTCNDIVSSVKTVLGQKIQQKNKIQPEDFLDVPDSSFSGPF